MQLQHFLSWNKANIKYSCKLENLTNYDTIPPPYSCVITKWLNRNYYSILSYFIPYNTYSYYTVIIITLYQTCPIFCSFLHLCTSSFHSICLFPFIYLF